MKQIRIISGILVVILSILWWGILDYHQRRKEVILKSWNDLQLQVADSAARAVQALMELRIEEQSWPKDRAEVEALNRFIRPIQLLDSGGAWFYNKYYAVFDEADPFDAKYRGKSMCQIFTMQKANGAHHYETLCHQVEQGKRGSDWYVWLPRKGKEYAAWTPVRVAGDAWTVGISTPEAEIYKNYDVQKQLIRELIGGGAISALLLVVLWLIVQNHSRNQKMMAAMARKSQELFQANQELFFQLKERKRVEKERERLAAELENRYREERDAWKAVSFRAAHKVGNAIFGLRGDVDWLYTLFQRRGANDTEMETAIMETREGLNEASRIIREFKKYYRPEEIQPEETDLNGLIKDAISHVEKAAGQRIRFETDFDPEIGLLKLDRTRFRHCMTELIENACHFIPSEGGKIRIETSIATDMDKQRLKIYSKAVAIRILDNGPGVPEDNKKFLFQPFFSTNPKGSGMGLAIVRQYVELHGGRIDEVGRPGYGAEFLIVLPIYHHL